MAAVYRVWEGRACMAMRRKSRGGGEGGEEGAFFDE